MSKYMFELQSFLRFTFQTVRGMYTLTTLPHEEIHLTERWENIFDGTKENVPLNMQRLSSNNSWFTEEF